MKAVKRYLKDNLGILCALAVMIIFLYVYPTTHSTFLTKTNIFNVLRQNAPNLLLSCGIDKDLIYRRVYHNFSESRLRLEGYILYEKLDYDALHHTALFTLTRDEMARFDFKKGDTEGIVNLPLQIKGTRLSISLREDPDQGLIRVSLRSVDDFPCNQMAKDFFNGGGHKNASGGRLFCGMEEAEEITRKAIHAYSSLLK